MKHITDIELAWKYLNQWCDLSSRLNGDSMVMLKEMERLKIKTRRLLGDK